MPSLAEALCVHGDDALGQLVRSYTCAHLRGGMAQALAGLPLARLEASAVAAARTRAAALRAQAAQISDRIAAAPSLRDPADALATAVSQLPSPPPHLPLLPPLPPPSTRVRYLSLCVALVQRAATVDDAHAFAALVRACEALPPSTLLRARLFDVLQHRRPTLLASASASLADSLSALQWPHAPLTREPFPPANSSSAATQALSSLVALGELAGPSAAAGALTSQLSGRVLYLSASLGAVAALPALLDALRALLQCLPASSAAFTASLWPHAVCALVAHLKPRYAHEGASGEGGVDGDQLTEQLAEEVDGVAQLLLTKYAYPPLGDAEAFPSVLSLLAPSKAMQEAWAARVEHVAHERLRDALEAPDAWHALPFADTDQYPALPAAAHALPAHLVALCRRLPGASAGQHALVMRIASHLVQCFLAQQRAAAVRAASTPSAPASLRCAPLNALVYVRHVLLTWHLRDDLPARPILEHDTEDSVKRAVKEGVAQVAAHVCRSLGSGVERSAEAWWLNAPLDPLAEEACAVFAMHLALTFPHLPTGVHDQFLRVCAGQLQALLFDRVEQLLVRAPKLDIAARLRALQALAARLLAPHTSAPTALLRPLAALVRIAEGAVVADEIAQRLPAQLFVSLLAWRDSLH